MSVDLNEEWDFVVRAFAGRVGSGWIRANCPLCYEKTGKPDVKASLGLNISTGGYNCFKCESKGRIPEHLRDEIPYAPPLENQPVAKEPVQLAEGYVRLLDDLWDVPLDSLRPALEYVRNRGVIRGYQIPDAHIAEAGIGAGTYGRLLGRLVIPLPDYDAMNMYVRSVDDPPVYVPPWRGWVSRIYPPYVSDKTYLYAKNLDRDGYLYNEPALWRETSDPVYVVEGTLDVLALWPNAVAVLGKPLDSQIEKLVHARRPVVVALDGDAHEEGLALALKLRFRQQRAGNIRFPPRIDPDEVDRAELEVAAHRSLDVWGSVDVRGLK